MKIRITFLIFLLAVGAVANADNVGCDETSSLDATLADNPVVKVAPKYPNKGTQKFIPGCALLTFSLDRSAPTSTPKDIKVERATEKRFGKAAKSALSKWLYINKNIPESSRYYVVFHFELSNS